MAHSPPRIRVPLLVAELPAADRLLPYLERIDRNRWYSNFGPLVQEFEERLADSFIDSAHGAPIVVTVANGTVGIELALRALQLPPGSRVLVPALTFVATANAVLSAGLRPTVCDIDRMSWLLTPEIAQAFVRDHEVKAVVPVATYGCPQDTEGWSAFHARTAIPVVIDAAAAFGNQLDCGPTCSIFSLHATKTLSAGEGGFIVTRDPGFARAVRQLSNFGINLVDPVVAPIGAVTMIGTNGKMSEYHAAVGLASLDAWPQNAARRRSLYGLYTDRIRGISGLRTTWQQAPDGCVRSVCCLLLDSQRERDNADASLTSLGVGTRRWYLPLLDRHPAFAHMAERPTPVADDIAERLLGIPFHLKLDRSSRSEVIAALAVGASTLRSRPKQKQAKPVY
jgi:dTDP-4-amino-4,6-dideoxygalactose transaminase